MDADEDLGLDKLFSEEVLGIIMTEPIGIDPALYNINLQVNMGNINPVLTNQIAGFWATSN